MKKKFESPYKELQEKINYLKEVLHIELQFIAEQMGVTPSNLTKIRNGLDKRDTEDYLKMLNKAFWREFDTFGVEKPTEVKMFELIKEVNERLKRIEQKIIE